MPHHGSAGARLVAGLASVAFLAGCSSASIVRRATPAPRVSAAARVAHGPAGQDPVAQDPAAILGDWRVVHAEGDRVGTAVRFGDLDLAIRQPCGEIGGDWTAAREGLFLAQLGGYPTSCRADTDRTPAWLAAGRRFAVRGTGTRRLLTIADGADRTVAVLRPGTYPPPGPDGSFVPGPVPSPDAATRRWFAEPAALPSGVQPVAAGTLVGSWRPTVGAAGYPKVVLVVRAGGSWAGSDGCNAQASSWEVGSNGLLLVDGFGQTLVGCPGAPSASLSRATRAGIQGGLLVLFDRHGHVLERLRRV